MILPDDNAAVDKNTFWKVISALGAVMLIVSGMLWGEMVANRTMAQHELKAHAQRPFHEGVRHLVETRLREDFSRIDLKLDKLSADIHAIDLKIAGRP